MTRSGIVALALGGLLLFPGVLRAVSSVIGVVTPAVVVDTTPVVAPTAPTPSADLQSAVQPITTALAGRKDAAKELALFFAQAAEVLKAAPYVRYTSQFAEVTRLAQESTYGKMLADDAVRPLLIAVLKPALGEPGADAVELDDAGRQKVIDRYNAISWAAYQAYKGAK